MSKEVLNPVSLHIRVARAAKIAPVTASRYLDPQRHPKRVDYRVGTAVVNALRALGVAVPPHLSWAVEVVDGVGVKS